MTFSHSESKNFINMEKKSVFVIITSDTCHNCVRFKTDFRNDLLKKLEDSGKINVVEINYQTSQPIQDPNYHPDLSSYIGWFPEFILFTGESWEDRSSKLRGEIMYGNMINGQPVISPGGPKFSVDGIFSWVEEKLSENLFKSSKIQSEVHNTNISQIPLPSSAINLPKYGISSPRHPTINPNSPQKRVIVLTDGNITLNTEFAQTSNNSYSPSGNGSTGYVPGIGMNINFSHSSLDFDIK